MDTQNVIWHAAKKLGSASKSEFNYSLCDADESGDVVPENIQKVNSEIQGRIKIEERTLPER